MVTVVGETSFISGHVSGDEELSVLGRVDGRIDLTSRLVVEHSGIVKAEVSVHSAVISGVLVGNLVAEDAIEIKADARVVGDLTAPRVLMEDGASFSGRVDMGDVENNSSGAGRSQSSRPIAAASRHPLTSSVRPSAVPRPAISSPGRPSSPPVARQPSAFSRSSAVPQESLTDKGTGPGSKSPSPVDAKKESRLTEVQDSGKLADVESKDEAKAQTKPEIDAPKPPNPPPPSAQKKKVKVKKRR